MERLDTAPQFDGGSFRGITKPKYYDVSAESARLVPWEPIEIAVRVLVIGEFEGALVAEGTGTVGTTAGVVVPAVGHSSEFLFSSQAMHDAQLHDVQPMIEGAGDHREARAGLLVERPESQVVAIEVVEHGANCARKEILRRGMLGSEEVVVDAPGRPDESIQDVRGRGDDVFLEPKVAGFIGEGDASSLNVVVEGREGAFGGIEIFFFARFFVGANQNRDSLPLRER